MLCGDIYWSFLGFCWVLLCKSYDFNVIECDCHLQWSMNRLRKTVWSSICNPSLYISGRQITSTSTLCNSWPDQQKCGCMLIAVRYVHAGSSTPCYMEFSPDSSLHCEQNFSPYSWIAGSVQTWRAFGKICKTETFK